METIFSKIIARAVPAHIVYEDELVLAFLDVNPVHHGHTLVVPKKHFTNIFDGDSEILAHMMKMAQKIGLALKAANLADGVNLIMNNGEAANQEVAHAHLHVVPRFMNDKSYLHPTHTASTEEEFTQTKNALLLALN